MGQVQKTVFISYRRTNVPWALAISQCLTHNGYDVFFDFTGIASGDFERVILESIKARAHFLVLLAPSALERVNEPGDLLRRDIGFAIDEPRNIVPLFLERFHFGAPPIARQRSIRPILKGLQQSDAKQQIVWRMWDRWISEIVADFWAVAKVGVSGTLGLGRGELAQTLRVPGEPRRPPSYAVDSRQAELRDGQRALSAPTVEPAGRDVGDVLPDSRA